MFHFVQLLVHLEGFPKHVRLVALTLVEALRRGSVETSSHVIFMYLQELHLQQSCQQRLQGCVCSCAG